MSNSNCEPNLLTDAQLLTLACLINAGAIGPGQYIGWSEQRIIERDSPPFWVLQLSAEWEPRQAADLLLQEAHYVMDGRWHILEWGGAEIAMLFLRHRQNLISWDAFLNGAINIASRKPSPWIAHDFQRLLDAYLENDKYPSMAFNQAELIEQILDQELSELNTLATSFSLDESIKAMR